MSETTTKACPFCGQPATEIQFGNEYTKKRGWKVGCRACNVYRVVAVLRNTLDQAHVWAVDAWNQRTNPSAPEPPGPSMEEISDA